MTTTEQQQRTARSDSGQDQGSLLVLDDDLSIRRLLQTRLSAVGYDVRTAADAPEGLRPVATPFLGKPFDLVLLLPYLRSRFGTTSTSSEGTAHDTRTNA